eukprot:1142139-Pelagomonas_calceolata.AAC.7
MQQGATGLVTEGRGMASISSKLVSEHKGKLLVTRCSSQQNHKACSHWSNACISISIVFNTKGVSEHVKSTASCGETQSVLGVLQPVIVQVEGLLASPSCSRLAGSRTQSASGAAATQGGSYQTEHPSWHPAHNSGAARCDRNGSKHSSDEASCRLHCNQGSWSAADISN